MAVSTVMTSAQNGAGKDAHYANGKPGTPGPGPDSEADDEIEWLQYHKSFEARGYNVRLVIARNVSGTIMTRF